MQKILGGFMRSIKVKEFGGPKVCLVDDNVTIPQPTPTQVLIKIDSFGINPVDTYIRSGMHVKKPALPYTPGSDAAGSVFAVGNSVKKFKEGDRVYTSGTVTGSYSQYATAEESTIHPLPPNVTFQQGAGVNVPYATAYHALFQRGRGKPGETLLIHGATGGVGIASVQFAVACGFNVIGTAGTDSGRELLLKEGVKHVLDHRSENHFKEVMELTNGNGVDIILEMLANINLANDLKVLAMGGRVCIIGSRGPIQIDPRDTMGRRADILGLSLHLATTSELAEIHSAIFAGLSNKTLNPIIAKAYKLDQTSQAHEEVITPPTGALGKLVVSAWE